MKRLTDETTLAARAVALWLVRIAGIVTLCIGFVGVGDRLIYAIGLTRSIASAWQVIDSSTGMGNGFMTGVPLMVCGAALLVLSRPIARWVIRPADRGCAGCGYATEPGDETCSECGRRVW